MEPLVWIHQEATGNFSKLDTNYPCRILCCFCTPYHACSTSSRNKSVSYLCTITPCSLGTYKTLTALYTEPMADTERPPNPLPALTQEEQQEPAPSHSPARGEGSKLGWLQGPTPPAVGAASLMAISCTMGCSWGSERLVLVCNQHSLMCSQSSATPPSLCYHPPLEI